MGLLIRLQNVEQLDYGSALPGKILNIRNEEKSEGQEGVGQIRATQ